MNRIETVRKIWFLRLNFFCFHSSGTKPFGNAGTEVPKFDTNSFSFSTPQKPFGGSLFGATTKTEMPKVETTGIATPSLFSNAPASTLQFSSTPKPVAASTTVALPISSPTKPIPSKPVSTFKVQQSPQQMKPVSLAPSGSISQGTPLVTPIPTLPVSNSSSPLNFSSFKTPATQPPPMPAKTNVTSSASASVPKPSSTSDSKLLARIKEERDQFELELRNHAALNSKVDSNVS